MKKFLISFLVFFSFSIMASAQGYYYDENQYEQQKSQASITFKNRSDYSMVVKIIKSYGGLYTTVYLGAQSSRTVTFDHSSSYKLKIKATHNGRTSYHKGGDFSVTCTEREWTEGSMEFRMSTYGSGLGPTISAKEFEKNN